MKSATFIRSTEKGGEHHVEIVYDNVTPTQVGYEALQILVKTTPVGTRDSDLLKSALIDWDRWVEKHEN